MPTRKSGAAAKKRGSKKRGSKKTEEVVMWVRLPRPMDIKSLKRLGLDGAACFGGDTCIAATATQSDAGIVLQADLEQALKKAKLTGRAAACFGGDTCIV